MSKPTSSSSSSSASIALPVFGLATGVLFVLKVAGMAGASWGLPNLSWFWVAFPMLLGFAFFFVIVAILLIIILLADR